MRALWIGLAFMAACTPARRSVQGDIVRNVTFSGNGTVFSGHNDYQLVTQMESEESAFGVTTWPMSVFVEPKLIQPDTLVRDTYRLEVWYAHHGWLDARFEGWSVHRARRQTRRKAGVVDVHGRIAIGPRSFVRRLEVTGVKGSSRVLVKAALRSAELQQDAPFDLDLARLTQTRLQTRLQRGGFAYAKVGLTTDAYPEETAVDVELHAEPGIPARFGAIEIEGNTNIPERFLRDAVNLKEGEPYRLDKLISAQNRLFAMDTFSLVTVQPDLSDPTRREVPIRATVTESKFRALRFGAGLKIENANWEPRLTSSFKHTNVLKRLIQFRAEGQVGVSGYTPLSDAGSAPTLVWKVGSSLIYPHLLHRTLSQQLEVNVAQDLDQTFVQYFNPEIDFRTIFKPSDAVLMSLGPHLEIFEYPKLDGDSEALELARLAYGEDFEQSYRLTTMDFGFTLDWRDNKFSARRGSFFNTTIRAAFPLEEGDYSFVAFSGDWRLYRPLPIGDQVPFTLATRIHGKTLLPIGESGLPYPELAFLGGASDMRGYPTRGMGPYSTSQFAGDNRYVPRGGTLSAVFSQEVRYHAGAGFTYAVFGEVATLANPGRTFGDGREVPLAQDILQSMRGTGGVGLRYDSSIGPLRLDFALRPYSAEDCGPVDAPFNCRNGGDLQRRLDLVRTFSRTSTLPGMMVFFAFGEAI